MQVLYNIEVPVCSRLVERGLARLAALVINQSLRIRVVGVGPSRGKGKGKGKGKDKGQSIETYKILLNTDVYI